MKKLFTLLTLALLSIGTAWAETYTDEAVTVTWSMADGASSVGAGTPAAAVLSTSWAVGTNMKVQGTGTYFTRTMTTFRTITSVGSKVKSDGSYVEWTFTPNPGLTFTPLSVSFNVVKDGTGDPSAFVDFIDGGGNVISLASNATIIRNNAADDTGINLSYSLDGKGAVASSNAVKLRVYTGKHANGKNVGFSDVVITGKVTGTTTSVTTYTINVETSDAGLGIVSGGNDYAENADVELTATALTGGKFEKWQIKNGDDYEDFSGNTVNPLTFEATADATYKAIFKALYKITFAAGEGAEIGTNKNDLPTTYAETTYTTPAKNSYISKAGYTATGWTDGINNYAFGEEITLTGDIELQPIFVANTKTLADFTVDTDVTWEFRRKNGGAPLNIENATGYYIIQQSIAGETVDLPIYIDNKDNSGYAGKRGKTNNVSSDAQTQVNPGSVFTLPAVKGMKISINAANAFNEEDDSENDKYITQIGGVSMNSYLTDSKKGIVYTYDGNDATVDIIFGSGFGYLYNIVVEYPGKAKVVTIGTTEWATFVSNKALDFTGISDVKAYIVTGHTGNAITVTQMTGTVPANTPLLLEGTTTSIPVVASSSTDVSSNLLKAGTAISVEAGKTKYVLANDGGTATFMKVVSDITVPATKAYLEFNEEISAPALSLNFEDVTGINEVQGSGFKVNGYYDLQGRKVAQPTKGLYIVNGKKVVIK